MNLYDQFYKIYDTKLFFTLSVKEKNSARSCRKRGHLPRASILERVKDFVDYKTFIAMMRESKDQRRCLREEDKAIYEKYKVMQIESVNETKKGKEYWLWKARMMGF